MNYFKFSFPISSIVCLLMLMFSFEYVFAQKTVGGKLIKKSIWKNQQVEYVDRQIAVKIKTGIQSQDANAIMAQHQGNLIEKFDKLRWGLIELPEGIDIFSVIDQLKKNPSIEAVEPNGIIRTSFDPSDSYYLDGHQWALKNTGQNPPSGTNDADIDAPEAWNITQGSSDVIIAILDSGIPMLNGSPSHPDLDDVNKIIMGRDFIETFPADTTVRDSLGHGTHVAGIASAETNNSTGVAGVAGGCRLLICQVFDSYGYGSWSAFKNAVIYSVDNGANVINFSGGGPYESEEAYDALAYANSYNVFVAAAAGNNYADSVIYPAAFSPTFSNVLAIGATDQNDSRSSYSNVGSQINVVAPGGYGGDSDEDDIYSTTPNYPFNLGVWYGISQNYGYMAGTSMATPHVSGIAGLILSVNPNLSPSQVRSIIQQTIEDKGVAGFDIYFGYGRVNAYKALKYTLENYGGTITQSFTIPSGETWNFQPGVVLKFANNVSLTVDGILNATGTSSQPITFTSASGTTAGSWGSITFSGSGASGSKIEYGVIQYGTEIFAQNVPNWGVQVLNCTIENTINGVRFHNTNGWIISCKIINPVDHGIVAVYGATASCYWNEITKTDHSGFGILFNGGSSDYVLANKISGFNQGFGAIWGSSPILGHPTANNGINNHITDCLWGLEIREWSYPVIGCPPDWDDGMTYGNNVYDHSDWAAYVYNCPDEGPIYAEYVYWGTTDPEELSSLIYMDEDSDFDYSNPLSECTWHTQQSIAVVPVGQSQTSSLSKTMGKIQAVPTTLSGREVLSPGIKLRLQGKYSEAKEYFKTVIKENPMLAAAYVELYNTQNDTTTNDIENTLSSLPEDAPPIAKMLLSNLYLRRGNIELAKQVNDALIKQNPDSKVSAHAKLNNFYIALYNENNVEQASLLLNEVSNDSKLSNEEELSLAKQALNIYRGVKSDKLMPRQTVQKSMAAIPARFELDQNFPNPFNPNTVIRYQLPVTSSIDLKIYDILGREVAVLAAGIKEPGYYNATFNGSGLASGIYFVRFTATPSTTQTTDRQNGAKPFSQTMKILLTK